MNGSGTTIHLPTVHVVTVLLIGQLATAPVDNMSDMTVETEALDAVIVPSEADDSGVDAVVASTSLLLVVAGLSLLLGAQ